MCRATQWQWTIEMTNVEVHFVQWQQRGRQQAEYKVSTDGPWVSWVLLRVSTEEEDDKESQMCFSSGSSLGLGRAESRSKAVCRN
jgi:hypothetical protein